MSDASIIVEALTAGAAVVPNAAAPHDVRDHYHAVRRRVLELAQPHDEVRDAIVRVEARPASDGRVQTLREELDRAGAWRDAQLVAMAREFLDLLRQQGLRPVASYQATVVGDGAVAQGPGATAVGARGVSVGGGMHGSQVITGDGNVVGTGNRVGGIRAGKIVAQNVVDGVQLLGSSPQDAARLVGLARQVPGGGIDAQFIRAHNVVTGLQHIADPARVSLDDLRQELASLRAELERVVSARELPDDGDIQDATEALDKVKAELESPQPSGSRVVRALATASDIFIKAGEVAEATGRLHEGVARLSSWGAALWMTARLFFGC